MFPIRDDNPTSRFAWMTLVLIVANVAVFGYEWLVSISDPKAFEALVTQYAFVPARFFDAPLSPAQWLTVFTAMFMHGGWLHVGGNMLYLWIFGNNIEDRIGPLPFLVFYLMAGVVATAAQAFIAPGSAIPNLGASGAVAGVLAAYLLLYPRARVITLIFIFIIIETAAIPAWILIVVWFVLQLGQGLGSIGATANQGGVAYFAHVGGFVAGLVMALPLWVGARRSSQARFADWR